jgi:serine/threonine-protein kinase RsbW
VTPLPQLERTSGHCGFSLHNLPADASEVDAFRRHFTRWIAEETAATDERRADIVLAVYEAVANAAEHAYPTPTPDATMNITARYRHTARTLDVTVTDHGTWKQQQPTTGGRGLLLIRALTDTTDIATGPAGTTVTLQWRLFSTSDTSRPATP